MKKVTNAIWYLDGRVDIINDTSKKENMLLPSQKDLVSIKDSNVGKNGRKKHDLTMTIQHVNFILTLLSKLSKKDVQFDDIIKLSSTLSAYVNELTDANDDQQRRHQELNPSRKTLSEAVNNLEVCEPILVDDDYFHLSVTPTHKLDLLSIVPLADPVLMVRCDCDDGSSVMHFIQRIPPDSTECSRATRAIRMLSKIEPSIPIYCTRAMRKAFKKQLPSINSCEIQSHILRHICRQLTGDASAEISSAEIDHPVKLAIETDDPDLIIDLRHLNTGRPGNTFDVFFRELEFIVEEITVADDRRHRVAHMSEFLSIKDLMSQVKHRVPDGTPIPSESTVIHAFAPPNIHAKTAQYYTGRINLKHVVQRRQLRAFHADAHWCSALYKYLKELAVLNRDSCMFISYDDKAKVNLGEPGFMISSGVRGMKSIVPTTKTLGSLDHDVDQKGIIIPTVILICDVPVDISGSFYRGNVHVTLKASLFQPSCSYRFGLELIQLLRSEGFDSNVTKHRVCFESVKIPLIMLFKELGLESLVSSGTAPCHSYTNGAGRITSILNI